MDFWVLARRQSFGDCDNCMFVEVLDENNGRMFFDPRIARVLGRDSVMGSRGPEDAGQKENRSRSDFHCIHLVLRLRRFSDRVHSVGNRFTRLALMLQEKQRISIAKRQILR